MPLIISLYIFFHFNQYHFIIIENEEGNNEGFKVYMIIFINLFLIIKF